MDRTLARISILASAVFLVAVLALLFLAPEVDPLLYGISFYALTDFGAVIGVAIAFLGIGGLIQRLDWFAFTVWLVFKAWQVLPTRLPASA